MPRLLMVCSTTVEGSGMMSAVLPLVRVLGGLGSCVRLVGPTGGDRRGSGESASTNQPGEVPHRPRLMPQSFVDAWGAAKKIAALVRRAEAVIVHVHGVWMPLNMAACVQSRLAGLPYVISPHGMLMPAAMRRGDCKKRLALAVSVRRNLELAAAVHVSSQAEQEAVLAVAPRARTVLIPWGVDIPEPRGSAGSGTDRRRAAYLGRIIPLKGVDDLITAWAAVRPGDWDLHFVGEDSEGYAETLQRSIDAADLHDRVAIHPARSGEELLKLIRGLDLLVLPSHSENFGMVVAEALAAGVPVITTTATPWPELVDRACGWWVSDTPAGLAVAISEATALPPEVLRAMGERGRSWMRESFGWPTVAARFIEELYETCL